MQFLRIDGNIHEHIYITNINGIYIYILQPTFTSYIQFVSEDKETTLQMAMEQSLNDREHDDSHQWNGAPNLQTPTYVGHVSLLYILHVS